MCAIGICVPISAKADLKVAVIDTGIDLNDARLASNICKTGSRDFTGEGLIDTYGHGTHVVGLIEKYAGNSPYCITMLKWWSKNGEIGTSYLDALTEAVESKANIVNLSLNSNYYNDTEYSLICDHPEITFVVAAGNQGHDLSKIPAYPAAYGCPNIIVVGAINDSLSNYGPTTLVKILEEGVNILSTLPNNRMGYMSGTSMSCAIRTGKLIHETTH
jgi:subtilisin family serine protease